MSDFDTTTAPEDESQATPEPQALVPARRNGVHTKTKPTTPSIDDIESALAKAKSDASNRLKDIEAEAVRLRDLLGISVLPIGTPLLATLGSETTTKAPKRARKAKPVDRPVVTGKAPKADGEPKALRPDSKLAKFWQLLKDNPDSGAGALKALGFEDASQLLGQLKAKGRAVSKGEGKRGITWRAV